MYEDKNQTKQNFTKVRWHKMKANGTKIKLKQQKLRLSSAFNNKWPFTKA